VLPHGDHIYSADLTATPSGELMPPLQFFSNNLWTPPCAGSTYRVAMRYSAQHGTAYPTPTMLGGVRNPALYGYTSSVAFLKGYAGWDQGLTEAELAAAADTLLNDYNETRRLTAPTAYPHGQVLNNPAVLDYVRDSRVSLKARPVAGFAFRGWTGDVPAGGETANPLILTMDIDRSIEAVFTRPPAMLWFAGAPAGEALIQFTAQADVPYTVEYSDAPEDGSWQTLVNVPASPSDGVVTHTDPDMPARPRRFYRVLSQ
jgi:hypothetical protein